MNGRVVMIGLGVAVAIGCASVGPAASAPTMSSQIASRSAVRSTTDARLVQTLIDHQLVWLRGTGSLRRIGPASAGSVHCNSGISAQMGRTATSGTGTLQGGSGVKLAVEDFVYSDVSASKRAFSLLASREEAACTTKAFVAQQRKYYAVRKAVIVSPKPVRTGDQAHATETILGITYKGKPAHLYYYKVVARVGRVIIDFVTVSGTPVLVSWSAKVAYAMTEIAAATSNT